MYGRHSDSVGSAAIATTKTPNKNTVKKPLAYFFMHNVVTVANKVTASVLNPYYRMSMNLRRHFKRIQENNRKAANLFKFMGQRVNAVEIMCLAYVCPPYGTFQG